MELMTTKEAAEYLHMSETFLTNNRMEKYQKNGFALPYIRIGRRCFYNKEVLDNYLREHCMVRGV